MAALPKNKYEFATGNFSNEMFETRLQVLKHKESINNMKPHSEITDWKKSSKVSS